MKRMVISRLRTRIVAAILPCVSALSASPQQVVADEVIDWNNHLLNAVKNTGTPPPRASRAMAMTQIAVFNAVNAVDPSCNPYGGFTPAVSPDTSPHAAAVEAAFSVLDALFPTQHTALLDARAASLDAIPDSPGKTGGIALGQAAASHILSLRSSDHSTDIVPYTPGTDPGQWRPTPPGFFDALLPQWATVTPFAMSTGSQFRLSGPPDLTSPEYAAALNRVKELGAKTGSTRTPDQTQIAYFWADGAGTVTPPGHWNQIAQGIASTQNLSLAENARLFALLGIAVGDAGIACWDTKYAYGFWRPVTAIRDAELDGNDLTIEDDTWEPLLTTPNFPEYTSGHSTFSGAAAGILRNFFGDDISFSTEGLMDALGTIGTRSYTSFSQAADEAGDSRIYGGIHFDFSNDPAVATGQALADMVFGQFLTPVPEPMSSTVLAIGGVMLLGHRSRKNLI